MMMKPFDCVWMDDLQANVVVHAPSVECYSSFYHRSAATRFEDVWFDKRGRVLGTHAGLCELAACLLWHFRLGLGCCAVCSRL